MKYKVTKKEIIKAVMTEPLIAGRFFVSNNHKRECSVCAVGAVLRAAIKDDEVLYYLKGFDVCSLEISHEPDHLESALKGGNFFDILSTMHEHFAYRYNSSYKARNFAKELGGHLKVRDVELQRLHLLSVVEAFCPAVVEFEVK